MKVCQPRSPALLYNGLRCHIALSLVFGSQAERIVLTILGSQSDIQLRNLPYLFHFFSSIDKLVGSLLN